MKKVLFAITALPILLLLFPHCAKVVTPTGGPKDTLPPVLVQSLPALNETNYFGNRIVLEFDEFIQLKDLQQKLLVSPPLKNKPMPKQKGKRLEIEFLDTLRPNTTYTLYFSDAIQDNNEGNPINNFTFAFSTGPNIDTLSISGSIRHSFTSELVENALIMLYDSQTDTLPYVELPKHIAKSDKDGKFTLVNLKPINYKIVTITDKNGNYLYNKGVEDIAFLNHPIKPESVDDKSKPKVELDLFTEEVPSQVLTGYDRNDKNLLLLYFSRPPLGGFNLKLLNQNDDQKWYIPEPDANGDTLKLWITQPEIASSDTLRAQLSYLKTDSLYRFITQTDTLRFLYHREEDTQAHKGRNKSEPAKADKKYFNLETSLGSDKVVIPGLPFEILLPVPAKKVDETKILIFNETDSLLETGIKLQKDSINPRKFRFTKDWKSNVNYKMLILPHAFTDYFDSTNDTAKLAFTGADPEKFGTLTVQLNDKQNPMVAELLTEKGAVVQQVKVDSKSNVAQFSYITPGRYKLRFIDDINGNGRWDTGSYMKGLQPERVIYFTDEKTKGVINIRANWDSELQFSIPKP